MTLTGAWNAGIKIAESLLDWILPPRPRTLRLRGRVDAPLPATPRSYSLGRLSITTLMDYRAPEVEDAIRALKYDGSDRATELLADVLAEYLREEIATVRAFSQRRIFIVPVPLHPNRRAHRGFNQVECVINKLPPEFHDGTLTRVASHALTRTRSTSAQTRLSRRERIKNVRGAFAADERLVRGAHVYVVDDVSTTGATLAACADALEHAGAQVTAVALSRA